MGKLNTKETIIKEGARLIHAKGYNNTGLKEILNAAGVPKGSFYFYFQNKEDFGLNVLESYAQFIQHKAVKYAGDKCIAPLERLEHFFDAYQRHFKKLGFKFGCPIGNLMQEMSDLSDTFRARINTIYSRMQLFIEECLADAQNRGDISQTIDINATAKFIIDSWEGAIMHMKLCKNEQPLEIFKQHVFRYILTIESNRGVR